MQFYNKLIILVGILCCVFLLQNTAKAQYTFGGTVDDCPTNLIIATCSGTETFLDTYSNNPNDISGEGVQICSNDGSPVTVTFTTNTVEGVDDDVVIYDGTNQYNFPVLGFGNEFGFNDGQPAVGATYTSTGGCIYVMVSADAIIDGQIGFDIDCAGGGAGSGLFTEPVGPGTAGDGISAVNDDCANAYTLSNTYNQTVTLVANNYDATSGPGDNTCDPDPSDVSGQFTLETTVYFEYCTDADPGLYQGHGILNVENCIRPSSGGLGETSLLTGTCGNFTPVSFNIGDQLPASTCFTFMVDGLNGDECQFQPFFDESPPPTCDPQFIGTAESMWLPAPDCGFQASFTAIVDWGSFFTSDPCVTCVGPFCDVNITSSDQLVFVPTTEGVITPFDACSEGTELLNNDENNFPAHSGGCEIEWYTVKYRITGSSPNADCVCDGYCFESPAANFPVFPDYLGSAFADISLTLSSCNPDGTYNPTEIDIVSGSACDGVVTVANSVIQPDPGCGNPSGDDLLVVELAVTPTDFPADCGAAVAATLVVEGITCECPAQCGATYDFVVDDFCSSNAAFFDLQTGCSVEVAPNGQPYVDFDWYIYAPGGVPQQAPGGYDPLPVTNYDFPISNPDLILDGSETACSDVAGSTTITNNTCEPIIVTYFMLPWDRQFDTNNDGDGGEYLVGDGACMPLQFDVTIYPEPFTAVETGGNCGPASVEIQAANGDVCPPLNGEATSGGATTDLGCGVTDNQTFSYDINYFAGSPCAQNITGDVASTCFGSCPPPAAECSSYLPATAGDACSDQNFVVTIPLNECPGTVSVDFTLDFGPDAGGTSGNQTTWVVTDALGGVVASGGPYGGADLSASESVGPLDVADGPYTLTVDVDPASNGQTLVTVTDPNNANAVLYNVPVPNVPGGCPCNGGDRDFSLETLVLDPFFDLNVNWYANGTLVNSDLGVPCNNFSYAYVLTTDNVCEPEPQQISYEVICLDGTPTTLTSEVIDVLVYPKPPTGPETLVSIVIDSETCTPMIEFQGDCSAEKVTVTELTAPVCGLDGTAEYEVSFDVGIDPPSCCETAGPPTNATQSETLDFTDGVPSSQFNGNSSLNALCFTIPPIGMGFGNATAYTFTFNFCNITHPAGSGLADPPQGADPSSFGEENYFATFYINGAVIYDFDLNTGGSFPDWTLCGDNTVNLLDIPGYDENSSTEICLYPNDLAASYGTDWDISDVTITLDATYELMIGTPVECTFVDGSLDIPYTCSKVCPTPAVTDGTASICSGDLTTEITDWQATVAAANPATDVDGTFTELLITATDLGATTVTVPDGSTPSGTFAGPCGSDDQFVYAYIGCDVDCDEITDSYIKAGTLTLSVFAPPQAPTMIVRDDAVCNYSVTFACTGDTEGTTTVDGSTQVPAYPGGTADVEVVTANGCTATFPLTVPPCPQCPSVLAPADATQAFCVGSEAPDFADAATGFIPGTGTVVATLMWYMDQTTDGSSVAPTTPYSAAAINQPADNCSPASTPIYAYYVCDVNGDGSLLVYNAAGSITVEIYPIPDALVETTEPGCVLEATPATCATPLVVEYSTDGGTTWNAGAAVPGTPANGDMADIRAYVAGGPTDTNGDPLCTTSITVTAEECCPTDPMLDVDMENVCGSGSVTLSTAVTAPGTATFTIMGDNGIGTVTAGSPIALPANNTCDPITYTFTATVVCDGDGSNIPETTADDLLVSVTVYPNTFSLVEDGAGAGACGATHLDVVAADGSTVCFDNVAEVTCTEPTACTDADDTDSFDFSNTYFAATACPMALSQTVSCLCAAPACICPTDPMLSADVSEVCGGGSVTLSTAVTAPGTATFTIMGDNGIGTVTAGSPIALPANNTCDPITYTFTATAVCDDNSSNIPETTADDLTATVTVYPNAFTAEIDGTEVCGDTHLDIVAADGSTVCADNVATASCTQPTDCTAPNVTDSGTYTNTFFMDTPCAQTFTNEEVSCNCPAPGCNCPTDPSITASITEACGAGSVTITSQFGGGSGTGTFTITGDNGIGAVTAGTPVALPANNTCDPITYTFTATAVCDDNGSAVNETTAGDLTKTVTVYPNAFTAEIDGSSGCGDTYIDIVAADGSTVCADNVATASCTQPTDCTAADATDSAMYSNTFFTGTSCVQTFTNEMVSCTCAAPACNCPTDPMLTADITEACGGGSVTLSTMVTGVGGATFTITGDNSIGTVTAGTPIALPANDGCDPITYTFTATAVCDDNSSNIAETTADDLTATVTVYPNAFTAEIDGTEICGDTHLDIVAADGITVCADNVATASCTQPTDCTDPAATDSGTYTNTFFSGTSCTQTFTNEEVSCNCPAPGCNCPTDPSITADIAEACGSASVTITSQFGGGSGTGTFTITGDNGIGAVTAGTPVALPANNTCDPITYTFTATVVCTDDGSNIAETTAGDLTATVTVYPNAFTAEIDGNSGCGDTHIDIVAADGSTVCADNVATASCTQPADCTDPDATDSAMYSSTFFTGTSCVQTFTNEMVSCTCAAPSCTCPTDPMLTADVSEVCGGGSVTLSTTVSGTGTATFTITGDNGIGTVSAGTPIALPANDGCDPITYTFTASAICDANGTAVIEAAVGDLEVSVTVYPNAFTTVVDGSSGCGDTFLDVVAADGLTVCDDNVAQVSCSPPATCGVPDDTDNTNWSGSYFDGTTCTQSLSNIPLSCSCAAAACNCPTNPMIVASETDFCESGTVTITASFGGGSGTGVITITGDNGIGAVTSGTPVNLPTNTTCFPIVYTFTATATCDDSGDAIPPANASDVVVEVTVYPNIGASLIEVTDECSPGVVSTCTSDITIMYDLDGDGSYESNFPPAAVSGGVTVDYVAYATGAPAACETTGSYFNACTCNMDIMLVHLDNGTIGSAGPFYYNTAEVDVFNGYPPFTYEWSAAGYVRNAIINSPDVTPYPDGNHEIRVIYADNAMWTVTITDITGCQVVATNDPNDGAGGVQEVLDITADEISGDNCMTRGLGAGEGSITIWTEFGTPPYTYEWSGPFTWNNPGTMTGTPWEDVGEEITMSGLPYGWYAVTVTDSGDPNGPFDANGNPIIDDNPATPLPMQTSQGWYWVECERPSGRGKVDVAVPQVDVVPNPFGQQTNISFSVPVSQKVTLSLYTITGQKVIDVFSGTIEGKTLQEISFEAGPLTNGLYMLELVGENGQTTHTKMIIANRD